MSVEIGLTDLQKYVETIASPSPLSPRFRRTCIVGGGGAPQLAHYAIYLWCPDIIKKRA